MSLGCASLIGLLVLSSLPLGCGRHKSKKQTVASATANPQLNVVEKLFDFGTVTEGDTPEHVFVIENTGSAPLVIDRVTTSCSCVVATPKVKEIAPGARGEVLVSFSTTGRRGANRKSITLLTNDPKAPRFALEVAANVESLLALDPYFVRLNPEYGEEQIREAWFVGKLLAQAKPTITGRDEDKELSIELVTKDEGSEKIPGLRFKLKGKKVGFGSGKITLATGLEKPNELVLRYSWSVRGNLRVLPAQLYFDSRRSAMRERILRVSSSRSDFKLKDAKVVAGPFKAELLKSDAGTGLEIKVTLNEGTEPTPDAKGEVGKLMLTSNDPLEPKKEVALRLTLGHAPGPFGGPGMPGVPTP